MEYWKFVGSGLKSVTILYFFVNYLILGIQTL